MSAAGGGAILALRDIHSPPAPPWWPPAPGWWAVAALVLGLAALAWWWLRARRLLRQAILAQFDAAVDAAATPAAQVAAISELLRRAARRRDPAADRLQGAEWLAFLDADTRHPLGAEAGALLLDGPFRADVAAAEADALREVARRRYQDWMGLR